MNVKPQTQSFKKADKIKKTFVLLSVLSLLLFIVLPFSIDGGVLKYGYQTYDMAFQTKLWMLSGFNLSPLIVAFQIFLVIDIVVATLTMIINDVGRYYNISIALHKTKLFFALILAFCGFRIFNDISYALIAVAVVAIIQLIIDKKLTSQVAERYEYAYPHRGMFFLTLITFILIANLFYQNNSLLVIPYNSEKFTELILPEFALPIALGLIYNANISLVILLSLLFIGIIGKTSNKEALFRFDFWRNLLALILLIFVLGPTYYLEAPTVIVATIEIALFLTAVQLVMTFKARKNQKKVETIYQKSIIEKPWRANIERKTFDMKLLPVFVYTFALLITSLGIVGNPANYSIINMAFGFNDSVNLDFAQLNLTRVMSLLTFIFLVIGFIISLVDTFVPICNNFKTMITYVSFTLAVVTVILFTISGANVIIIALYSLLGLLAILTIRSFKTKGSLKAC